MHLREALTINRDTLIETSPDTITYRRGDQAVTLTALRGRSEFERAESDGEVRVLFRTVDWIVKTEELIIDGVLVEPQRGDLIETDEGQQFEVSPGNSESAFRWTNSYRTAYRIFTLERKKK